MSERNTDREQPYHSRGNGNSLQQDLWRVEDELKAVIREMRVELVGWNEDHTIDHRQQVVEWNLRKEDVDGRIGTMIHTKEIAEAKREGALGVFRFLLATLNSNWKVIAVLLTAVAAILNRITITLT